MAIHKSKIQEAARKAKYASTLLKQAVSAFEDLEHFYFAQGNFGGDGASLLDAQFAGADDTEGYIAETGVSRNDLLLAVGVAQALEAFLDSGNVSAGDRRTIVSAVAG